MTKYKNAYLQFAREHVHEKRNIIFLNNKK